MGEGVAHSLQSTSDDEVSRPQRMTGGHAIAEMLRLHGAKWIFGMAGFQLLPFYDALHDMGPGLRHLLIKDERSGAFMANSFARVAGQPGVCDATLGPGATNLITGLAESYAGGVPVVAIAGGVHVLSEWRGATQESDQFSMIRPTVKAAFRIVAVERIPELVRRAYLIATAGRPGPVLIEVPENTSHEEHTFSSSDFFVDATTTGLVGRRARPDKHDIDNAAALLVKAKRPIVLAGGGIHMSGAHRELLSLAELLSVPVATTITGKGAISERHPLSVGVFGRFTRTANQLIQRADCIVVVGCKLGEVATNRWTLLPAHTPTIQLDVDAVEIGKNVRLAVGLLGDAKLGLRDLAAALGQLPAKSQADRTAYSNEVKLLQQEWEQLHAERLHSEASPIHQARLMHELNQVLPESSIVVADGGFAAHWSALYFESAIGCRYIANRGNASIGYGLPAAIGAKLADPNAVVVGLTGDGGLSMTIGELETAVRAKANVVLVVVNNESQGYVKALQHQLYGPRYESSDYLPIDYSKVAADFGWLGERVVDPHDLPGAIRRAIEAGRPALIDVMVTKDPAQMLPGVDSRTKTGGPT